jgi:hypothetical protein
MTLKIISFLVLSTEKEKEKKESNPRLWLWFLINSLNPLGVLRSFILVTLGLFPIYDVTF